MSAKRPCEQAVPSSRCLVLLLPEIGMDTSLSTSFPRILIFYVALLLLVYPALSLGDRFNSWRKKKS